MPGTPKRFADRAKVSIRKYQKILDSARKRDVNESDTAVIISDMLSDVLGYDKYHDVTTEFGIRNTFCDLAIKNGGTVQYLIEVKSIGTDLRENHLRQAIDYGAKEGVEWILLTNGFVWQAHRIRFEQPVTHDLVFAIDLCDPVTKLADAIDTFYLISKDAGNCSEIDKFWKHKEATSRFVLAQAILDPAIIAHLRRDLRALFPGLRIDPADVDKVLRNEVIKRDALEGEKADAAVRTLRKAGRKRQRAKDADATPPAVTASVAT